MNFYDENLRVLNFTHIDFDGVISAIVVKTYYKNVITEQINYGREQEAVDKIIKYKDKIDAVVFTDFTPVNIKALQAMGKPILVLDHHESCLSFNDPQNNVHINLKYCGAMLAFKYFSVKKDMSHLNDLVFLANDYDLFTLSDPRSMPFNALYWQMGFRWFMTRFMNGNTKLYPEEKQYILDYQKAVQLTYDNLPISDLPHKGCFYECEMYMAEMSRRLANDGYQYQIIKHGNALSIRSATDNINLLDVCKYVGDGGGHRRAAGIPLKPGDDIKLLVQKICFGVEHVLNNPKDLPF